MPLKHSTSLMVTDGKQRLCQHHTLKTYLGQLLCLIYFRSVRYLKHQLLTEGHYGKDFIQHALF